MRQKLFSGWIRFELVSLPLFALFTLAACSVAGFAQHTAVSDAGDGRKSELDYDAAGKIVQQRIIGADGKVVEKVSYETLPQNKDSRETTAVYWPDGKVRKNTQETYDLNANFTDEFIQAFDETGKQTAGHKLTHNPWTGAYNCSEWDISAQAYKAIHCPAGEESGGAPAGVRIFTRAEVVDALEAAETNAASEAKDAKTSEPGNQVGTTPQPRHAAEQQSRRRFQAPAMCFKGDFCVVRGPFNGNKTRTIAAFEKRPATIVLETKTEAYIAIPDATEPGQRPLFIREGPKLVALPVTVGKLTIKNNGRDLQPGQTLTVVATLEGPPDLPDEMWRRGNFPSTNLDKAKKLVPGFRVAPVVEGDTSREHHEDKEEAKKGGEVLMVVRNETLEQIALSGADNQTFIFHLNDESFEMGEFKYSLIVTALKAGPVDVRGYVVPLLAPVLGQEFDITPTQPNR
jgi:hypothetical protein